MRLPEVSTELEPYRSALSELAEETRDMLSALMYTAVEPGELAAVADRLRAAAEILRARTRSASEPSPYDLGGHAGRAFSVVHGIGHPLAAPLVYSWHGDIVEGRGSLNPLHEGPKGHAHGGISAMLLDDVMARVPELLGLGRVTRELAVTYRRPIPLGVPILVTAQRFSQEGTRLQVRGQICPADEPDHVFVRGEASFTLLRDDQMMRIIPGWRPGLPWPE